MLEGDIETSYTKADNSAVVPTDTSELLTEKDPPQLRLINDCCRAT